MKRSITKKILLVLSFLLTVSTLFGQDDPFSIDEDDFFGEDEIFTDIEAVEDDNTAAVLNEESVSFTGDISAIAEYGLDRSFLDGEGKWADNSYTLATYSNLLLDVRLKEGIKAFANLSLGYFPGGVMVSKTVETIGADYIDPTTSIPVDQVEIHLTEEYLLLDLKEFFIDVNLGWKVYFRLGKQVLNWGRGYLWNPSDLVNVEQRSFNDLDALRSGSSGLKMHIPVGTTFNFYSYLNFTEIEDLTDVALAAKAEALLGNTEFSFSGWWKKEMNPIFGLDFSTRLLGLDIWGEASLTAGEDITKISTSGNPYTLDNWITRTCLGLSRSFDFGEVTDRILVVAEFYFNQAGYDVDMFDSSAALAFLQRYYTANSYGKYYLSLFTTINELFGNDELSGSINALGNFSDLSFVIRSGLSFSPVDNFSSGITLITPIGEENREYTLTPIRKENGTYTFSGTPVAVQFDMTLNF